MRVARCLYASARVIAAVAPSAMPPSYSRRDPRPHVVVVVDEGRMRRAAVDRASGGRRAPVDERIGREPAATARAGGTRRGRPRRRARRRRSRPPRRRGRRAAHALLDAARVLARGSAGAVSRPARSGGRQRRDRERQHHRDLGYALLEREVVCSTAQLTTSPVTVCSKSDGHNSPPLSNLARSRRAGCACASSAHARTRTRTA